MPKNDKCSVCGKPTKVAIFRGTGVCSENCRKSRDNDWLPTGMKKKGKK